ncbi:SPW repeat domain-containing protein [Devosia nitrariae]|nr:SPW repeat protein [Devosia nitrariae]
MSTFLHGIGDYVGGIVLILAPYLFGFATGGIAQWLPMILGAAVIVYSLFTDFELGVVRVIPMRLHLIFDGIGGLFLAASPWLFGFSTEVFLPHLIFGILEIGASLTTQTQPRTRSADQSG